jgi:tetratricopeptide (TPR) repeat protein
MSAATPIPKQALHLARLRTARHYLDRLRAAESLFRQGGTAIRQAAAALETDLSQICEMQRWASEAAADNTELARWCSDLARVDHSFLSLRLDPDLQLEWQKTAQRCAQNLQDPAAEAHHTAAIGSLLGQSGHFSEAIDRLSEAHTHFAALGDGYAAAYTANLLGEMHEALANMDIALTFFQRCQKWCAANHAPTLTGLNLINLGKHHYTNNDFESARLHYQNALSVFESIDQQMYIADTLIKLGEVEYTQRRYASAKAYQERALAIGESIGYSLSILTALRNLLYTASDMGDYEDALKYGERSAAISRREGFVRETAITLLGLGGAALASGDLAAAEQHFKACAALTLQLNDPIGMAFSYSRLGYLASAQGRFADSLNEFQKAHQSFSELGDVWGIAMSNAGIGNCLLRLGRHVEALTPYRETLAICKQIGEQRGILEAELGLGRIALAQHYLDSAHAHLVRALQIALDMQVLPPLMNVSLYLCEILHRRGSVENAAAAAIFIAAHPATADDIRAEAHVFITSLRPALSDAQAARAEQIAGQLEPIALVKLLLG